MHDNIFTLKWLIGDIISDISFDNNANRWSLVFKSGSILIVDCLWRLHINGYVVSTSLDHGQKFGLLTPYDVRAALGQEIGLTPISEISVKPMVADLEIQFGHSIVFEVIRDSACYETWQACTPSGERVTALGSGDLST
jgi:hypothetical protein